MNRRPGLAPLLVSGLLGCGGQAPSPIESAPPPPDVWFEPHGEDLGVDFHHTFGHERRFWFPEIMGSGVGLADIDADGDLDLYCVQSGDLQAGPSEAGRNRGFHNDGRGRFEASPDAWGAADPGYGMGCGFGDADDDGDLDLYVTNVGPNAFFVNDGSGRYRDATEATGTGDRHWGTSVAFFDDQGDGDLDLFVVNYLGWSREREIQCSSAYGPRDYCNPNNYNAPSRDVLYRNEGGLRFVDATRNAGIDQAFGNGLGVTTGDFNDDGRVDVYVANDLTANQLWLANPDGTYRDEGLLAGCAVDANGEVEAGMGVLAIDAEGDGDLDLFMTHLREQSNTFYLNDGGLFSDATALVGLSEASFPFTGFGVGAADFDQDGRIDLFVANGRVTLGRPLFRPDDPFAEPNQLFRGTAPQAFAEVPGRSGLARPLYGSSRGTALGDLDGDGDVDAVVLDNGGGIEVLMNVRARGHWLVVRALTQSGRDAYDARVGVSTPEGWQWRAVQAAYSYCSSGDPRAHFGLGPQTSPVEVVVRWPDGQREGFGPLEVDRTHVLRRGSGTLRPSPDRPSPHPLRR